MEKEILNLFLYNHKLKFSDIGKSVNERSNKVAYHLKNLVGKELIKKSGDFYMLSEKSEVKIPYLTSKNSVLAVVLIAIRQGEKVFLIKRDKRPFDDKLCLPGGRLIVGETIKEGTERIMKEKFNLKCKFEKVNSVHLEHVKRDSKTLHSFLLIFVSAKTNEKISYASLRGNKNQLVSSDYHLIKNDLGKKTTVKNLITR